MLIDEIQSNLEHETRVAKCAYTLVKPVFERKVPFFPKRFDRAHQFCERKFVRLLA